MSQLSQSAKPSDGASHQFSKLTWSEFVQVILDVTVRAYLKMKNDRIARIDWEENVFTLRLGKDYIHPLTFDEELPIRVWVRTKTHTRAMYMGEQAAIEAKEIDMLLFDVWEREYHKTHFVWEAKRVGDKRVNSDYGGLNSEYVNEAIYRFIRSEYAGGLRDAGVLGYVLAGDVPNIVNDVNESMGRLRNNPTLSPSNHMQVAPPIGEFNAVYKSSHTRTDTSSIQLHHLFLTFDFP